MPAEHDYPWMVPLENTAEYRRRRQAQRTLKMYSRQLEKMGVSLYPLAVALAEASELFRQLAEQLKVGMDESVGYIPTVGQTPDDAESSELDESAPADANSQ